MALWKEILSLNKPRNTFLGLYLFFRLVNTLQLILLLYFTQWVFARTHCLTLLLMNHLVCPENVEFVTQLEASMDSLGELASHQPPRIRYWDRKNNHMWSFHTWDLMQGQADS